eukprot:228713-Rhodomonas_salina.1
MSGCLGLSLTQSTAEQAHLQIVIIMILVGTALYVTELQPTVTVTRVTRRFLVFDFVTVLYRLRCQRVSAHHHRHHHHGLHCDHTDCPSWRLLCPGAVTPEMQYKKPQLQVYESRPEGLGSRVSGSRVWCVCERESFCVATQDHTPCIHSTLLAFIQLQHVQPQCCLRCRSRPKLTDSELRSRFGSRSESRFGSRFELHEQLRVRCDLVL